MAGNLAGLREGDFELRLTGPDGNQSVYASLPVHIAPSTEAEMENLAASDQPLRHLADSTGGSVLTLEQVGSLPDRIAKTSTDRMRLMETPLWDSYYLFLFVLACLGAEWALRKHVGLV